MILQRQNNNHNKNLYTRAKLRRNYIMQRRNLQPHFEQEAEEADEHLSENSALPSSESEGEDLIDNAQADYQPIPELDAYEKEGIDDQYYQVNPEERKAAEKQLRLQEKGEQFFEGVDEFLQEDSQYSKIRQVRHQFYEICDESEQQAIDFIDAEQQKGPFQVWFQNQSTKNYIKRKLIKFITTFRENGQFIYNAKLKKMCLNNEQSLVVQYNHIKQWNVKLTEWLAIYPSYVIPEYSAVVYVLACKTYPSYKNLVSQSYFKVSGLPVTDHIRTLSFNHLTQLIKVQGVVTCTGLVYSQLRKIYFKCIRCGYVKGPFYPNETIKIKLGACNSCHVRGSFIVFKSRCIYRNYQTITIQQSPSSVAPGRIPRSKEAVLLGDNIDKVKPGDQIEATGIFTTRYECVLNIKQGFPVFHTYIEINHIETIQKAKEYSKATEIQFQQFSKQPNFARKFFNSIAPSIYGHVKVKKALTLALFGGVQKKNSKNYHRTRGDINVLMLGDPGIAKSQFLKSIQKIFPRCIYTTGKGASAVGLTAAVKQDSVSKEWKLEAGALVLADKGVCLIDQFDKMSQQDRTSIHEAMEQQTISISKAGIVATLNARCTVIAAANPLDGIYNQRVSFRDNVDLSEPILSRFDILTVIKDRPDAERDGKLASFVINQHMKNHPDRLLYQMIENQDQQEKYLENQLQELKRTKKSKYLDQGDEDATLDTSGQFIKQYIAYARQKYQPKLSQKSSALIKQFYTKLREFSHNCGGINIVVRHLESMIRLAEAHARMHLRKQTNQMDTRVAISTMLRSFIDTQRHSTAESIRKAFKHDLLVYD